MSEPPVFSRWVSFAGGALVQTCAGLFYTFGVYAPLLKSAYGLSQTGVQGLGAALLAGGYAAPPGGALYAALQDNPMGPRMVLWLGGLLCVMGYGGLYLLTLAATISTPLNSSTAVGRLLFQSAGPAAAAAAAGGESSSSAIGRLLAQAVAPAGPAAAAPGGGGGWVEQLPVVVAGVCLFVAGLSGNLLDTGVLVTNVANFREHKGPAIGLLKALLGLGPSLFTSTYYAAVAPSQLGAIGLLALLPPTLVVLGSVVVNRVPQQPASSSPAAAAAARKCFATAYALVSALALHQLTGALLPGARSGRAAQASLAVAVCLLLGVVGVVAWMGGEGAWHLTGRESPNPGSLTAAEEGESETARLLSPSATAAGNGGGAADGPVQRQGRGATTTTTTSSTTSSSSSAPAALELSVLQPASPVLARLSSMAPHTPRSKHRLAVVTNPWQLPDEEVLQALRQEAAKGSSSRQGLGCDTLQDCYWHPAFWLLFGVFAVGVGSGLAFSNNLQAVVAALQPPGVGGSSRGGSGAGVALVSLFSVGSCFGRLLFGYLPDQLQARYDLPRPAHLIIVSAAMAAVNLACGLTTAVAALYPLAVLYGVTFGALWCLVPAVTAEIFGEEHFAPLYTSLILAPALGCWLLAAQLAGRVYDAMSYPRGGGRTGGGGGYSGSSSSTAAAAGGKGNQGHMRLLLQQPVTAAPGEVATAAAAPGAVSAAVAAAAAGAGERHLGAAAAFVVGPMPGSGFSLWPSHPSSSSRCGSSSSSSSGCSSSSSRWVGVLLEVAGGLLAAVAGWAGAVQSQQQQQLGTHALPAGSSSIVMFTAAGDPTAVAAAVAGAGGHHPGPATLPIAAAAAARHLLGSSSSGSGDEGPSCIGPACFRLTFMVLAVLCGVASLAARRLLTITRQCYSRPSTSY